ncbi:MAG TPA: RNA polymerase sigma-G factor [Clostridiales bacterium]|nr:MAG: hypothetical protein A2Y18_04775 [Clostridiales bacterium GWD2_32_19]HCC07371.1 RNA polymerase sigma-G factor [Clostridiales bacterium]
MLVDILELIDKAQSGDKDSKETIVKENLKLVWSIVRRIHTSSYDKDDLFQIGCIGLIKAIQNFNENYNAKFSTYAYILILSEIKLFLRDDSPVKVSRHDKEIYIKIKKERENLKNVYNREPKISELAHSIGVSEKEITSALEVRENTRIEYLYDNIYSSDGCNIMLIDKIESPKHESEEVENKVLINQELSKLDKEEQQVVILRYYGDKKQDEVAKILNKTQVQISRIEKRAIEKMRNDLEDENA